MNNAEQDSVQTEDCYCVPVYSYWKHNRIDMERVQKACMVISWWKGVKIHCGSRNTTSQSLHWICSSAHTKTKELVLLSVRRGMSSLQVRLALSCAQAALAAMVDKGRNMGEHICWVPLSCSLYHALLGEGFVELQKTRIFMKVTPEKIHMCPSACLQLAHTRSWTHFLFLLWEKVWLGTSTLSQYAWDSWFPFVVLPLAGFG